MRAFFISGFLVEYHMLVRFSQVAKLSIEKVAWLRVFQRNSKEVSLNLSIALVDELDCQCLILTEIIPIHPDFFMIGRIY